MSILRSLTYAALALVPVAAAPRAIYCLIKIVMDSDQATLYKQRLKNLGLYVVIAVAVLDLLLLIQNAYLT